MAIETRYFNQGTFVVDVLLHHTVVAPPFATLVVENWAVKLIHRWEYVWTVRMETVNVECE